MDLTRPGLIKQVGIGKTSVTRKAGEELDLTGIVERIPKKLGWMFRGCFSGIEKGPSLF